MCEREERERKRWQENTNSLERVRGRQEKVGTKGATMVDEKNIKTVICDRGRENLDGNVVIEGGLSSMER